MRRYAAQLEALSEQDPLTGLPNRRAFQAAVQDELRVFALGGEPCSVLLAQVDDGDDTAIVAAAEHSSARAEARTSSPISGHGELAVMLPSVDRPGARRSSSASVMRFPPRPQLLRHRADRREPRRAAGPDSRPASRPRRAACDACGARTGQGSRGCWSLLAELLEMPVSFLSRLDGRALCGRPDRPATPSGSASHEGDVMPLGQTYCQRMLDGRIGSTVPDLAAKPHTRELELTTGLRLRAYAGVPVRLRSGESTGRSAQSTPVPIPSSANATVCCWDISATWRPSCSRRRPNSRPTNAFRRAPPASGRCCRPRGEGLLHQRALQAGRRAGLWSRPAPRP